MRHKARRVLFLLLISTACGGAASELLQGRSGYSTSDRVRQHDYLEAGRGPAIVFVPGWDMPAWIWDAQRQHFSQHYHVVALDPRSPADSAKVSEGNYPQRRA